MAVILEQSNIDELVQLQLELDRKKTVALTAKEKIGEMFISVLGYPSFEGLDTLDSIGRVITEIATEIKYDNKYMPSFLMLKQSYEQTLKQKGKK